MRNQSREQGFIRLIVAILIIVLLFAFFPRQMSYAWEIVKTIWSKISGAVFYFWNLFIVYIWQPFLHNLSRINGA